MNYNDPSAGVVAGTEKNTQHFGGSQTGSGGGTKSITTKQNLSIAVLGGVNVANTITRPLYTTWPGTYRWTDSNGNAHTTVATLQGSYFAFSDTFSAGGLSWSVKITQNASGFNASVANGKGSYAWSIPFSAQAHVHEINKRHKPTIPCCPCLIAQAEMAMQIAGISGALAGVSAFSILGVPASVFLTEYSALCVIYGGLLYAGHWALC